jgi:hypothetical protein
MLSRRPAPLRTVFFQIYLLFCLFPASAYAWGASLAEKQLALNCSVHLVGDLHQPLHVGFLYDLGRTKTKVTFHGKEQSLRELWDSGIVDLEKGSARAMAKRLDQRFSANERKTSLRESWRWPWGQN